MPLLIAAVVAALLLILLARPRELFRITIVSGTLTTVRGRVPAALLADIGSVVRGVERGRVSAHWSSSGAQLSFRGDIDADVAQRLRNVMALYPLARLRR